MPSASSSSNEDPQVALKFAVPLKPTVEAVGLDEQLNRLLYGLVKPVKGVGIFKNKAMLAPSGALLHGPPGTGKTLLAHRACWQANINSVSLKASEIHSKWTGISEKIISTIFAQAKLAAPSIIVIDEIDCIFPSRSSSAGEKNPSVLAQLLTEMDNVRGHQVALVATTNLIDSLDPALLRRLPVKIEVPLPSPSARQEVLLHHIGKKIKHALTPPQILQLSALTSG
ncbi:hypothetical protein CF319_g9047, partial [Tilletia indica]